MIEILMEHLREDLNGKTLPAKTRQDAKKYIEEITGMPIT
jgi:hypothetical protein